MFSKVGFIIIEVMTRPTDQETTAIADIARAFIGISVGWKA